MNQSDIQISVATEAHTIFAKDITDEMESSAKARGTGIAQRTPEYVTKKMIEGKAVVAYTKEGEWVGFCYIEVWEHNKFVANSGLIVAPQYRKTGVAKAIKKKVFDLSREKFPDSKIFGLTTGLAVMKINSDLGYEPVTYSELTTDEQFWAGCKSCVNYDILMSKDRKNCMCTAMLFDPKDQPNKEEIKTDFKKHSKIYERFMRLKQSKMLKFLNSKEKIAGGASKNVLRYFFNF